MSTNPARHSRCGLFFHRGAIVASLVMDATAIKTEIAAAVAELESLGALVFGGTASPEQERRAAWLNVRLQELDYDLAAAVEAEEGPKTIPLRPGQYVIWTIEDCNAEDWCAAELQGHVQLPD